LMIASSTNRMGSLKLNRCNEKAPALSRGLRLSLSVTERWASPSGRARVQKQPRHPDANQDLSRRLRSLSLTLPHPGPFRHSGPFRHPALSRHPGVGRGPVGSAPPSRCNRDSTRTETHFPFAPEPVEGIFLLPSSPDVSSGLLK
jgi:hypothetical protein